MNCLLRFLNLRAYGIDTEDSGDEADVDTDYSDGYETDSQDEEVGDSDSEESSGSDGGNEITAVQGTALEVRLIFLVQRPK